MAGRGWAQGKVSAFSEAETCAVQLTGGSAEAKRQEWLPGNAAPTAVEPWHAGFAICPGETNRGGRIALRRGAAKPMSPERHDARLFHGVRRGAHARKQKKNRGDGKKRYAHGFLEVTDVLAQNQVCTTV